MAEFNIYPKDWVNVYDIAKLRAKNKRMNQASVTQTNVSVPVRYWRKLGSPPMVNLFYWKLDLIIVSGGPISMREVGLRAVVMYGSEVLRENNWLVPGLYPNVQTLTLNGIPSLIIRNTNAVYIDDKRMVSLAEAKDLLDPD